MIFFCRTKYIIRQQNTTGYFRVVVYYISIDEIRKEAIFIPYNLYIFLKNLKIFRRINYVPPEGNQSTFLRDNREGISMSTHTNEYDIEVFLCGFLAFMAKPNRARAPPRDFFDFNQINFRRIS